MMNEDANKDKNMKSSRACKKGTKCDGNGTCLKKKATTTVLFAPLHLAPMENFQNSKTRAFSTFSFIKLQSGEEFWPVEK